MSPFLVSENGVNFDDRQIPEEDATNGSGSNDKSAGSQSEE